jgi:hypothetical protein
VVVLSFASEQGLLISTAVLNTVLACMITFKLVQARKNALLLDVRHMASYFSFTARIVVESAATWTLSIIIVLAFSSPLMPALPQTMFPLFKNLSNITSVSDCERSYRPLSKLFLTLLDI